MSGRSVKVIAHLFSLNFWEKQGPMKMHTAGRCRQMVAQAVMMSLVCLVGVMAVAQAGDPGGLSEYQKKLRQCCLDYAKRKASGGGELEGTTRGILPGVFDMMGMKPPKGAVTLLGEDTGFSRWKREGGGEIGWKFNDGVAQVVPETGDICTSKPYSDMWLHVEFAVPKGSGNSGVYIQQRYEVQVKNSHGNGRKKNGCGALYDYRKPNVNASRPPGEWQSYDIVFRAPRWDGDGDKVENARITVVHNGELLHYDAELPDKTGAGRQEAPNPRPLRLQDHTDRVKYRNVWLKELELD